MTGLKSRIETLGREGDSTAGIVFCDAPKATFGFTRNAAARVDTASLTGNYLTDVNRARSGPQGLAA